MKRKIKLKLILKDKEAKVLKELIRQTMILENTRIKSEDLEIVEKIGDLIP